MSETGQGGGADMVPRSRLNEVIEQRNAAREQVTKFQADMTSAQDEARGLAANAMGYKQRATEAESQLQELQELKSKAKEVDSRAKDLEGLDALRQQVADMRGQLEAKDKQHERQSAMLLAGVDDPMAQRMVGEAFQEQTDKEDGHQDFGAFFDALKAAPPRWLTPYITPPAAGGAPDAPGGRVESTPQGSAPPAAAGSPPSATPLPPGNEQVTPPPSVVDESDLAAQIKGMDREGFRESGLLRDPFRGL